MKELTAHEMQYASGGILFSAAGALLGGGIGALIDWVLPGTDHFSFGDTGLSMGLLGGIAVDAIGVVGTLGVVGAAGAAGVVGVGLLCLSPLLLFI
ncbi:hypothetical protein [Kosakonia sp. MUSA4]|uniref:hypothetical protein n=1 Tax=Kosakonia sp. MUSA4 TaxID=2067958 RepID=UPI00159AC8A6|nr:hypothetical protein [Kosakonia sp. MUSA4]QJT80395.1 hypothetical protein C0557_10030 [Kosakonia sp. MUSA4]